MKQRPDIDLSSQVQPTKITFFYVLALTGMATLAFFGVIAYLLISGHGLLWLPDGTTLYYMGYVFAGELLRDAASSIMQGQIPDLSTYTFYQGYGADWLATMGCTVTNPLNITSAFFPPERAEYGYYLTLWLRFVLAGISFSLYCFDKGKDYGQTLVGAVCYLLCGYTVFLGILRHGIFLDTAILLPCILLGADRIFAGKSPVLFVLSIALSFFLSGYFTYIVCVILLAYCLIKYSFAPRRRSPKDFIVLVGKFVLFLVIGFAIGAITGLPYVLQLVSIDRIQPDAGIPLFQSFNYYYTLLGHLVGTKVSTRGLFVGIVPLLFVLSFLFGKKLFQKDECRPWLAALVLCAIATCIPWFGHAANGFNYVTDRWMIGTGFVLGYIACLCVPELPKLSRAQWLATSIIGMILVAVAGATTVLVSGLKPIAPTIIFLLVTAAFARVSREPSPRAAILLSFVLITGASVATATELSSAGNSSADEYGWRGEAYAAMYTYSAAGAVAEVQDDENYRYTMSDFTHLNNGVIPQMLSVSFYSSFYSQDIDNLRDGLGIVTNHANFKYAGNTGRLAIDALSAAKWCVARQDKPWQVPYSYEKRIDAQNGFSVFETKNSLPLAFSQQTSMDRATYETLDMIQRQEALLQACVIEDASHETEQVSFAPASKDLPFTIELGNGVEREGDYFIVHDPAAQIMLSFEGEAESETYVCLMHPQYQYVPDEESENDLENEDEISIADSIKKRLSQGPLTFALTISSNGNEKTTEFNTPRANTYTERSGIAANLGFHTSAVKSASITFHRQGIYSFEDIKIICQPIAPIVNRLQQLQGKAASNVKLSPGHIEAHYDNIEANSYALFSIAYSPGWSATINGIKADVVKGDVGFCAVKVPSTGAQDIILTYTTPGLFAGSVLSITGLIALLVVAIIHKRGTRIKTQGRHAAR